VVDIPRQWCSGYSIWRSAETYTSTVAWASLLTKDGSEDGLAGAVLTISAHREVGLFQPVDNLVCLGGNTGRVRLVMESPGNRVGMEEHPFCLSIVELFS
jgi:hypothetical protein